MPCPNTVSQEQINQAVSILQELFPQELIGIYLYGSAALDGLRPESDLDLLIFTDRPLTESARASLTQELLCLSGRPRSDRRPIELSVVNRHAIDPWRFPPRFEYMFGEWLRTDMENGTVPQPFSDPDNVLLLWQARLHAIPLTDQSPAIDKLIAPIPFDEIRRAIRGTLPNVLSSYKGDERNALLTLSRMWYTLDTRAFASKDRAALWAEGKVPAEHASLLRLAREAYLGNRSDRWDDQEDNVLCLLAFMRRAVMHAIGRKSSETDTLSGVDP